MPKTPLIGMAQVMLDYADKLPPDEFKEYVQQRNISYPLATLLVNDNISEYDLRVSMDSSNLTEYGLQLLEGAYLDIVSRPTPLYPSSVDPRESDHPLGL